jgi:hypothetical protein
MHTHFSFANNLGVCEEFEFERRGGVLIVVMMGLGIGK